MAEKTDTGDKHLKSSTKRISKETSGVKVPVVKSDPIVEKQETENMETHAYHLHSAPGKKIWHYFF